jgi:hypothetical protein
MSGDTLWATASRAHLAPVLVQAAGSMWAVWMDGWGIRCQLAPDFYKIINDPKNTSRKHAIVCKLNSQSFIVGLPWLVSKFRSASTPPAPKLRPHRGRARTRPLSSAPAAGLCSMPAGKVPTPVHFVPTAGRCLKFGDTAGNLPRAGTV